MTEHKSGAESSHAGGQPPRQLIAATALRSAMERDACGVGLVCAIDGKPRREVVVERRSGR